MNKNFFLILVGLFVGNITLFSQTSESQYKRISAKKGEISFTRQEEFEKSLQTAEGVPSAVISDISINIPDNKIREQNKFAFIIGNEDYSSYQSGLNPEINVDFAQQDAATFRKYAIKTLGVPESNVIYKINARSIEMKRIMEQISLITLSAGGDAEIYFYYAGHGFPDLHTRESYLIPVDVCANNLLYAIKLKDLYEKLTKHKSKRIVVFLDACFSGGARNHGLLAARGVKIRPKEEVFKNNIIVFSATSEDLPALAWREKGHGMFTYHLLKFLQETKANITYGELADYLSRNVGIRSALVNQREQTPKVNVGFEIKNTWREIQLR